MEKGETTEDRMEMVPGADVAQPTQKGEENTVESHGKPTLSVMESISGFWWALLFAGLLVGGHWLVERLLASLWPHRFAPKPTNLCPKCEQLALEQVYQPRGISNPPSPNCYLCQKCGARWKRYFTGPLEDATDSKDDYYFGGGASYLDRGEPDNGREPLEVVPFEPNWVKCLGCGWRFRLDSASRSGKYLVHTSCGQRLIVKEQ